MNIAGSNSYANAKIAIDEISESRNCHVEHVILFAILMAVTEFMYIYNFNEKCLLSVSSSWQKPFSNDEKYRKFISWRRTV